MLHDIIQLNNLHKINEKFQIFPTRRYLISYKCSITSVTFPELLIRFRISTALRIETFGYTIFRFCFSLPAMVFQPKINKCLQICLNYVLLQRKLKKQKHNKHHIIHIIIVFKCNTLYKFMKKETFLLTLVNKQLNSLFCWYSM